MDFDFVTATLDKYGLSDRFDAGQICGEGWTALGRNPKAIAKLRQNLDTGLVGGRSKSHGYTFKEARHIVIQTGKHGDYSSFSVTPEEMRSVADKALSPTDGKIPFTASASAKGAASDLTNYLHEVGHQVHWASESKDPNLAAKGLRTKPLTRYGAANNMENFAEGFALWTLDAKGLKEKNPEMHDYIQESVTAAMGAKRRMDSITNGLGMGTIAPVQPSDIAQTPLGQQAFTIVLSGDSSWDAYKSLDSYAEAAKVGDEQDETMAAIEAFIVSGGEFTEPIDFSRTDSPHFDSAEITRYTRAIASLNDRYGWHIDAQKVLSKLGKKLGKKCGKGWISPEKKCKSHYTNGKLNESGKASGENLADRIRQRKKLATVSRNGKGEELTYAFLPGNQKQSSMTARRTHAPRSGYETPGRLSKTNSTEERRSMVGLGQSPWIKQQPDDAPMMDRTPRVATPIKSGGSLKSLFAEADRVGAKYQDKPQTFAERRVSKQGADRVLNESGMSELVAKASGAASISEARTRKMNAESDRIAEKYPLNPTPAQRRAARQESERIMEGSGEMAEAYRSSKVSKPSGRKSRENAASISEPQTRKLNTTVPRSTAGDRIRAVAKALEDESKIQKGATVGILKSAEKLYVNQNKMIKEVATMVNEDLDRAAKGTRKMFDPAQTPVRIPNQRSSSEPRKRGRSVD